MGKICWLASYPKSGNTWLRALLANYQADGEEPVDINALGCYGSSARLVFDEWAGFEASSLDAATVDSLLPDVFRCVAREESGTVFFKAHYMFRNTSRGEPLFPADVSIGAVYVVRNVLDVAVSLAHHAGSNAVRAVERLGDRDYAFAGAEGALEGQLRQVSGSWSGHVSSWLDQAAIPVHLVRYEDLLQRPEEIFSGVVRFCGLPLDEGRVRRAVAFSRFEELQRQEQASGFRESSEYASAPFFRRGKAGAWSDDLPAELAQRLMEEHGEVLRQLHYLPETRLKIEDTQYASQR